MPAKSHGLSKHPLYQKWQDMLQRCYNTSGRLYPWYGAKGITVCSSWRNDVVAFIDWCLANGWKPGMEIDKDIKVPGCLIYSPATCSIVSHKDNMTAVVGRALGKKSSKLKLSPNEAADIIRRKDNGEKTRILAEKYSVDICTINRIYRKRR